MQGPTYSLSLTILDPSLPPLSFDVKYPLDSWTRSRIAGQYAARQRRPLRERAYAAAMTALANVDLLPGGGVTTRHVSHDPDDYPMPMESTRP